MSTEIVLGILGIIGTLSGVWLGNYLTKKTSIDLFKIQEFIKAATEFKAAFIEELNHIDNVDKALAKVIKTGEFKIFNIIKEARNKHGIAASKFRIYLPEKIRFDFDKVFKWFRYGDYGKQNITEHTDEQEARQYYRERINELFRFTDPKYVFK